MQQFNGPFPTIVYTVTIRLTGAGGGGQAFSVHVAPPVSV